MKKLTCKDCDEILCHSCQEFEQFIENENDVNVLQSIRRKLMTPVKKQCLTLSDKVADYIVQKVSNMTFFCFCICLCLFPILWKIFIPQSIWCGVQEDILFVSNFFQLLLLPIILIAGARQSAIDKQRDEIKFRLLLINDRIEEVYVKK
jgi:hypothetical protein